MIKRHPFLWSGLATRILGIVNKEKLNFLKYIYLIVIYKIKKASLYNNIWQAFAVLLPVKTLRFISNKRSYLLPKVLHYLSSEDVMKADFSKIPFQILERISKRILNEVDSFNRVVYDISSKPLRTIEWE